jgi:hypothetical protein
VPTNKNDRVRRDSKMLRPRLYIILTNRHLQLRSNKRQISPASGCCQCRCQ